MFSLIVLSYFSQPLIMFEVTSNTCIHIICAKCLAPSLQDKGGDYIHYPWHICYVHIAWELWIIPATNFTSLDWRQRAHNPYSNS